MPTIYKPCRSIRVIRVTAVIIIIVFVFNYVIRLFHLRLAPLPYEARVRAGSTLSEADFNTVASWLEFGAIFVLCHCVLIILLLWMVLREVFWRLWTKPSVILISARMLFFMGLGIGVIMYMAYIFLNPEAAEGTRLNVPIAFKGVLMTFTLITTHILVMVFLLRPQHLEHTFRLGMRKTE